MPDDDFTFGFDTSSFDKGISKVTKGLVGLQSTTQSVARGVSKGLVSVALKFGSIFAGIKAVRGALNNMPEIGEAFGIAKNIFLKNLLFPLRKEIFPLLQKMLDWVRDSRVSFVRWGQNIANVFRTVVSGAKNIIGYIKKMTQQVSGLAGKIFGDQVKDVNKMFDLVTFKLAVVVQYVSLLADDISGLFFGMFEGMKGIGTPLKGIIDNFGNFLKIFTQSNSEGNSFVGVLQSIGVLFGKIAKFSVEMADSFLDGLIPGIEDTFTPLQRIASSFANIFNLIFGSTESIEKWKGIFEFLGSFLGGAFMITLNTIASIIEGIETVIKNVQAAIAEIKEKGFIGTFLDNLEGIGKGGRLSRERVNDAIIRPNSSIVETHPDDTLIATKNPVFQAVPQTNNNQKKTFNISVAPTIIIQKGTESEGRAVATGLIEQMRNQFNFEFERGGN